MMQILLTLFLLGITCLSSSLRAETPTERYAHTTIRSPDFPKDAMPLYLSQLLSDSDHAATLTATNHMMDAALVAKLDPFNLHAIIHAERVGGSRWSEPLRVKFRAYAARWDYTKPTGVSLNYELMRDGAGWTAAGVWPDLIDAAGNDAHHIRQLCGDRLRKTLAALPREGSTEYDAPLYYGTDFMALRLLVDFADESDLREAARHVLETMLVQTGAQWHRGYAVTSAGRAKYWGSQNVSPDSPGATTAMAWLLFGGDRDSHIEGVSQGYWMVYPSPWLDSLEWLKQWQAQLPIPRSVRESILIPSHQFYVRKESWITNNYGLASQRTDGTSATSYLYKETRNATLRWVSDKPASTFVVSQENRRRPNEKIANAFAYGENPYSQTLQNEGTLLGVYHVPSEYGFWKLTVPFTNEGAIVSRIERGGWICAHAGSMLFAFRSIEPAIWGKPNVREKCDIYTCDALTNGWVLETSPLEPFAGGGVMAELGRFADALAQKTKITADLIATDPKLTYRTLNGHELELVWHDPAQPYSGQCRVDGQTIDYNAYPFLDAGAELPSQFNPQK